LPKTKIQNLLVVGVDTVSIANSAKEAGYRIYAADYFGDMDLRRVCSGCEAIVEQKRGKPCGRMESKFKPRAFLKMTQSLLQKHKMDAILLSSGLDDSFAVLHRLNDLVEILGHSVEVVEALRKKPEFFMRLKYLGIAHPETAMAKSVDEAKAAAIEMGYPVVVKPVRGFGGLGIRTAQSPKEIEKAFSEAFLICKDLLVQKAINGIHASVSFLVADKDVKVLTLNKQLLGLDFLFQREPFGYCGNTVPLDCSGLIAEKCRYIVEKIALHFGLKGSNGIDFVISEEGTPYVVEVNPRFQGTLECVEKVLGINLVESHVNACLHGFLPAVEQKTSTFCTRLILYAPERIMTPDLTVFREVRDVPLPGIIVEKGEPLCSIITEGETQKLSFQNARRIAESIFGVLHPA